MMASFTYDVTTRWTGDRGTGTSAYDAYGRDHELEREGAPTIPGSSDPHFRGDPARWSPEDIFVGALAACHELWYLHLCSANGIVVRAYVDRATGTMETGRDGGGRFTSVTLRPEIRLSSGSLERARELHAEAHRLCFLANSVRVPIAIEPTVTMTSEA